MSKCGRPSLLKGEPSDPVTVRVPRSWHTKLCRMAKTHNTSPAAFLRDAVVIAAQQHELIEQLLLERFHQTTNEQRADAFVRLLAVRAECPDDTCAACRRWLELWPNDPCAISVQQGLDYLSAQPPMSDADRWRLLTTGKTHES